MAKVMRICKVCGKEYEYCHTLRKDNPFRWQDVACCPEHGRIYFKKVMDARNKESAEAEKETQTDTVESAEVSTEEETEKLEAVKAPEAERKTYRSKRRNSFIAFSEKEE